MRRRALLRGIAIGVAATPNVAPLLDAFFSPAPAADATLTFPQLTLVERSLYVDVARAYTQWGRYEHGLNALRNAYEVAPEEIRCRPNVHRVASDLAILATGSTRTAAVDFAQSAGIAL